MKKLSISKRNQHTKTVKKSKSNSKKISKIYNYLIIGGGPAGLQISYYLEQAGQDYLMLERGSSVGEFFKKFPRHGTLISINKVHTGYDDPEINMRWDWNSLLTNDYSLLYKDYSKEYYSNSKDLVRYLKDFAKKYKLNFKTKQEVLKISKIDSIEDDVKQDNICNIEVSSKQIFKIETNKNTYYANKLIMATGISKPYIPNDIKGIDLVTQYFDLDTDKSKYINKRVLIIGKGNSAFETANDLTDTASLIHIASPDPLKFAYNTRYPGHLRSINSIFMDTYLLKSQNGILNTKIKEIKKKKSKNKNGFAVTFEYSNANGEIETIYYDHVISCTGFKFDSSIFDKSCMPELCITDRFPKINHNYESTNIPELYFTGNISQSLDFKKKQSAFIHGFRYNVEFLARYLLAIYNQQSLVSESINNQKKSLVDHILKLINKNSAMWQQTGYISCAYVFNKDTNKIDFVPNVPTDYIKQTKFIKDKYCLLVSLDFGECIKHPNFNALTHNRVHKENFMQAYDSSVIHPIVKLLYNGSELTQHHIIEDFENEWLEDEHVKPLEGFVGEILKHIELYPQSKIQMAQKSQEAEGGI